MLTDAVQLEDAIGFVGRSAENLTPFEEMRRDEVHLAHGVLPCENNVNTITDRQKGLNIGHGTEFTCNGEVTIDLFEVRVTLLFVLVKFE